MNKPKKQKRSRSQLFFTLAAVVFFALLIFGAREDLSETWELIKGVNPYLLLSLPLIQLLGYFFVANYYTSVFQAFKYSVPIQRMYPLLLSIIFVEQVLPAGGSTGIAYINYALRSKASHAITTLVQIGRYAFTHLAYMVIATVVLFMVLLDSPINSRALNLTIFFLIFMIAYAVIGLYILRSKKHINWVVKKVEKLVNKLSAKFRNGKKIINGKKLEKSMVEFHDGVEELVSKKSKNLKPLLFMTLSVIAQLTVIYLSFKALGSTISIPIIVLAFSFANFIGVLSIIPGDVGVHELAMVKALEYMGVDAALAISATLIYRVFVKLIVLAIGFVFYSHFIKPAEQKV